MKFEDLWRQTLQAHNDEVKILKDTIHSLRGQILLRENMERRTGRSYRIETEALQLAFHADNRILVVYPTRNQALKVMKRTNIFNISVYGLNQSLKGQKYTHVLVDPSSWAVMTPDEYTVLSEIILVNNILMFR